MAEFPSFRSFYRALHAGQEPFPWQERLAEQVAATGWPSEIGVPTGLGKTACLDIAIWSLARQAAALGPARTAPTRIWYVVNRRLLVDAAYDRATKVARLLSDPEQVFACWPKATEADRDALASVSGTLQGMSAVGSKPGPLHITRLRGGAELGVRVPDPSQPALIFATVPMFASRWLFRGYGSSTSMRPIDAALAGIDSLVLLDEAHIATNLQRLAAPQGPVELSDSGDPTRILPPERARPKLVAVTATGGQAGTAFHLDGRDLENETVRRRIHAVKSTRTASCPAKDLPRRLGEEALALLKTSGGPKSCVVFANSPKSARRAFDELRRLLDARQRSTAEHYKLLLLTGQLREREADRVRHALSDPQTGAPTGRVRPRELDLVVVATQTLEVGADLDFDRLVTESAGARAITQRLGRLNRLGGRDDAAAVVVHPEGKEPSPVYGGEAKRVWDRIAEAERAGAVDLGPDRIGAVVGPPGDMAGRVGELLPNHLWEWAKTSWPPAEEAPAELFYEGFEDKGFASVMWRSHLPVAGVRLVPAAHEDECVEVSIGELREALKHQESPVHRLARDRASLEEAVIPGDLRPGDVVVLEPKQGLYDEHGWNPTSGEVVLDVSPLAAGALTLEEHAVRNLVPSPTPDLLAAISALRDDNGIDPIAPANEAELVTTLRDRLSRQDPWHPWLELKEIEDFLHSLSATVARPVNDDPFLKPDPRKRPRVLLRSDAFEELSFDSGEAIELEKHLKAVGTIATRMARRLGFPKELVAAIGLAGELHDIGKADHRFQRWLTPGWAGQGLRAKSTTPRERSEANRIAAGWPRGGRHEQLSSRLASALLAPCDNEAFVDLVLHLIVSHHGEGRPLVPAVAGSSTGLVSYNHNGAPTSAANDLSQNDWEQPARFRRLCERFGYWGLALLETVVRQADHAVSNVSSAEPDSRSERPGEVI